MEWALEAGVNIDSTGNGSSALALASENGSSEIITYLLNSGADVNIQDHRWGSAVQATCNHGRIEILQILLDKGASVNSPPGLQGTAITIVAAYSHKQMAKVLLELGGNFNIRGGMFVGTPIDSAVSQSRIDIVDLFVRMALTLTLLVAGNIDAIPLNTACSGKIRDIAKYFSKKGGNLNAVLGNPSSMLHSASSTGYLQMVELLLEEGTDVNLYGMSHSAMEPNVQEVETMANEVIEDVST